MLTTCIDPHLSLEILTQKAVWVETVSLSKKTVQYARVGGIIGNVQGNEVHQNGGSLEFLDNTRIAGEDSSGAVLLLVQGQSKFQSSQLKVRQHCLNCSLNFIIYWYCAD